MRRWYTVVESAFKTSSGSVISSVSGLSSGVNPSGHSSRSQ